MLLEEGSKLPSVIPEIQMWGRGGSDMHACFTLICGTFGIFSDCGANCHKQCKDLLVLACRRLARAPSLGSNPGSLPGSPALPPGKPLCVLHCHGISPHLSSVFCVYLGLSPISSQASYFLRVLGMLTP